MTLDELVKALDERGVKIDVAGFEYGVDLTVWLDGENVFDDEVYGGVPDLMSDELPEPFEDETWRNYYPNEPIADCRVQLRRDMEDRRKAPGAFRHRFSDDAPWIDGPPWEIET